MIQRTKFALLLPCWDGHKFSIILEKNGLAVVLVPGLRQLSKNSVQLYACTERYFNHSVFYLLIMARSTCRGISLESRERSTEMYM